MTISPTRSADVGVVPAPDHRAGFYRLDLDGLRGIAIALVAMFHVWFGRVSGGVDVFLALSGFFFGGKLLRAALNPASALSPVPEVVRLVRRLLPALVVVLAGCPETGKNVTYWVWFARGEERFSVGKLTVGEDGSGFLALSSDQPLSAFDSVGITIELKNEEQEDVLVGPL